MTRQPCITCDIFREIRLALITARSDVLVEANKQKGLVNNISKIINYVQLSTVYALLMN